MKFFSANSSNAYNIIRKWKARNIKYNHEHFLNKKETLFKWKFEVIISKHTCISHTPVVRTTQ